MYALLKKDLIAIRWFLLPGLLVFLLHSVTAFQNTFMYLVFGMIGTMALTLAPLFVDEKYDSEVLNYWLPRRRCTVVKARYLSSLIWLVLGLGIVCGLGALCRLHFTDTNFHVVVSWTGVLSFLLLPLVLLTLFFPCYFRFGLARGTLVFLGLATGLGLFVVTPLVTGFLHGGGKSIFSPNHAAEPELGLIALSKGLVDAVGLWPLTLFMGVGVIGLVVLSLYLSIRFLAGREV